MKAHIHTGAAIGNAIAGGVRDRKTSNWIRNGVCEVDLGRADASGSTGGGKTRVVALRESQSVSGCCSDLLSRLHEVPAVRADGSKTPVFCAGRTVEFECWARWGSSGLGSNAPRRPGPVT